MYSSSSVLQASVLLTSLHITNGPSKQLHYFQWTSISWLLILQIILKNDTKNWLHCLESDMSLFFLRWCLWLFHKVGIIMCLKVATIWIGPASCSKLTDISESLGISSTRVNIGIAVHSWRDLSLVLGLSISLTWVSTGLARLFLSSKAICVECTVFHHTLSSSFREPSLGKFSRKKFLQVISFDLFFMHKVTQHSLCPAPCAWAFSKSCFYLAGPDI